MSKQQIEQIITKTLTGRLCEEEQVILDNWISQDVENKEEFEAYIELWKKSKELVLSKTVDVESSLIQTKKRIIGLKSKKRWIIYLRQIAAVLLVSVSFTFLYNYIIRINKPVEVSEQIIYQEIKAAFGTQTKLLLSDGTNIWLNSGSTLRFPASFNNLDERRVELNGEGYFEVIKNDSKPFIVNTSELDVKVYGTSFNVSAYDEYNSITVALVEGKVSLVKERNGEQKELIILNPNEVVKYNTEETKMYHSTCLDMYKYKAWKDGYIMFYNDPIDNVIRRLQKWYNVEIIIEDKALQNYRFTATFVDESLEQTLKLLSLSSPMRYDITPAQKQKDNSFSKRKIVLSIKK